MAAIRHDDDVDCFVDVAGEKCSEVIIAEEVLAGVHHLVREIADIVFILAIWFISIHIGGAHAMPSKEEHESIAWLALLCRAYKCIFHG